MSDTDRTENKSWVISALIAIFQRIVFSIIFLITIVSISTCGILASDFFLKLSEKEFIISSLISVSFGVLIGLSLAFKFHNLINNKYLNNNENFEQQIVNNKYEIPLRQDSMTHSGRIYLSMLTIALMLSVIMSFAGYFYRGVGSIIISAVGLLLTPFLLYALAAAIHKYAK